MVSNVEPLIDANKREFKEGLIFKEEVLKYRTTPGVNNKFWQ